jgi:hypothetical protein
MKADSRTRTLVLAASSLFAIVVLVAAGAAGASMWKTPPNGMHEQSLRRGVHGDGGGLTDESIQPELEDDGWRLGRRGASPDGNNGLGQMQGNGLGQYGAGSIGERGPGGLGAMTGSGLGAPVRPR